jgi:hypothetical protein
MLQVGNGLPWARSLRTCWTGGTHWGIELQLGAAKQRRARQPSTASAGGLATLSAETSDAKKATRVAGIRGADPLRGARLMALDLI